MRFKNTRFGIAKIAGVVVAISMGGGAFAQIRPGPGGNSYVIDSPNGGGGVPGLPGGSLSINNGIYGVGVIGNFSTDTLQFSDGAGNVSAIVSNIATSITAPNPTNLVSGDTYLATQGYVDKQISTVQAQIATVTNGLVSNITLSGQNLTITKGDGSTSTITLPAGATGAQGPAGATGAQGPAGQNGAQGPAGQNGANGTNGVSVTNAQVVNGNLMITLSNNTTIDVGSVSGNSNNAQVTTNSNNIATLQGQVTTLQNQTMANTAAITAETNRAQVAEAKIENKVERNTNVAGAIGVNIIAQELTPDELKAQGISFNSTLMQQNDGTSEMRVGVNKDLGNGFYAGVGVGVSDGNIGASVGKNIDVTENFRVGVGASADSSGVNIGPNAMLHTQNGYGVGLSTFGPSVMIGGTTLPVAGPLVAPNLVVVGVVGAYKAITGKTKAEMDTLNKKVADLTEENQHLKQDLAQVMAYIKQQQIKDAK